MPAEIQSSSRQGDAIAQWLCDAVAMPMYVHDEQGRLLDANAAGCQQLGYTRAELQALHLWDLEQGLSRADILDVWHRLQRQGQLIVRGTHRRKDGSTLPVDAHISRCVHGQQACYVLLAHDVSELTQKEAALAIHEQVLREVFEHAPVAMAMVDGEGCLVRCNLAYSRLLGYGEAELLGRQHRQLLHPDDQQADLRLNEVLARAHTSEYMVSHRYIHRGGHALAVQEHITAWNTPGLSFMAILMAWPQLAHPMPGALSVNGVDNPWPASRQIIEAIVHELNQPLNSLAMFAAAGLRLLKRGEVSADQLAPSLEGLAEQAGRAQRCAGHLISFLPQADDVGHSFSLNAALRGSEVLRQRHPLLQRLACRWHLAAADVRLTGSARTFEAVLMALMDEMTAALSPLGAKGAGLKGQVDIDPAIGTVTLGLELLPGPEQPDLVCLDESATWAICRAAIEAHGGKLGLGLGYGEAGVLSVQFTWAKAGCDQGLSALG